MALDNFGLVDDPMACEAPSRDCVDDEDLRSVIQQGIRFGRSAAVMRHVAGCPFCQREYREINRLLALGAENRLRESISSGPDKIFAIIRHSSQGERRRGVVRRIGLALGYGVLLVAAGGAAALIGTRTPQPSDGATLGHTFYAPSLAISQVVRDALRQNPVASNRNSQVARRSVTPGITLRAARPDNIAILSTEPVLTATAPRTAPWLFVLEARRGKQWVPIIRGYSTGHSFKVPRALARGAVYRWFVQAPNGQRSASKTFLVLDSASAAAVEAAQAEDAASSLRMALVYTYYGMADDAIRAVTHPGLSPSAARKVLCYVQRNFHTSPPVTPTKSISADTPADAASQDVQADPNGQPTH